MTLTSSSPPTLTLPREGGGNKPRIFASPLARRLAREAGIDLAALAGSGRMGASSSAM